MNISSWFRLVLILALGVSGCAHLPWSNSLKLAPCAVDGVKEPLQCGTLSVREDRGDAESRMIGLKIVVVPASGEKTLPPLYDLAGGPGLAATDAALFWANDGSAHRAHRDIVLVDQRGTGGSAPLDCGINFADPLTPILDLQAVRDCRERLSRNANLAHYTTAAAVEDLDDVRAALGHKRIDLSGLSYGTRLAQEYLRAYPKRVRAAVLLGTVSPLEKLPLSFSSSAQNVLDRLAQQCKDDSRCYKSINDMTADIAALRSTFVAGSVAVTLKDGRRIRVEEGPFWEAVRKLLMTTASQRRLPWMLHQAAYGNLEPVLSSMKSEPEQGSNGLLLSVVCPEDTLRITAEDLASQPGSVFGTYRAQRQIAACKAWRLPALENPRSGFVSSDVPVLLLAGGMDHVTPAVWADEVAAHLPNSRVVVIPNLGHFPDGLAHMECYDQLIADFFAAGSARDLDVDCVKSMQPPPFDVPKSADKPVHKAERKVEKKAPSKKKAHAKHKHRHH